MMWLKQSTAVTLKIGPFLDETNGKDAETGLTISQADVRLSKNGGNIAQKTESTACTHDELGIYGCPIDGDDTDTLGRLQLWVHESGALPVWHEFMVVPANVWDSMFGADALQVHATEITAGLITAAAIANAAIDNATFAADVGSTAYATNIIALAVRKVLDEINLDHLLAVVTAAADMTTEVIDNSILSRVLGNGDTSTFVPSTDGLHAAGVDLDAILADTNELQTDDYPTSIAAVKAETALIVADTNELQTDNYPTSIAAIKAETALIVADTNELQTDWADGGRLDLILDAATAPSAAAVADAVWDELSTGHVSAGKAGQQLWTDVDAILADTNELQTDWADGGRLDLILDTAAAQAGAGAITFTYTLTSSVDSAPIADAQVWVTSDQAGSNVLASGTTDANGAVVFYLDAGTVYVWRQKSGWNFTNPDTETVA